MLYKCLAQVQRRHVPTEPMRKQLMPQAAYDTIAEWYDEQVRTGLLLPFHELAITALLELLGDAQGQAVCDVACGQGIAARELARRGAHVTGVDISERLLEIARGEEVETPLGVTYIYDDAHTLATLPDAAFDAITCNLALMDIPDLDAVVAAVWRVLRPGGVFVFAITHPCTMPPGSYFTTEANGGPGRHVHGYFTEGFAITPHPPGVRGKVGTYHRTLSTYLNTLIATGFTPDRIAEPRATGLAAERQPGATEAPMFLVARFVKE
jgi:ubiquinone/menaquinone biosynthesis C-methylase UbiE